MISPERLAARVLDALGIRDPSDLLLLDDIAWARHRALVRQERLTGAEARVTVLDNRAVITVSSSVNTYERKRFCIAHEIGHLEMRHSGLSCSSDDIDSWAHKPAATNRETLSNQFAAALLLPERFLADRCVGHEPSLDHISQLASEFRVSLTATAIRYADLCQELVAIVCAEKGHIKWYHRSPDFCELGLYLDVGDSLPSDTLAVQASLDMECAIRSGRVSARSWFRDRRLSEYARLAEQSLAMPQYDAVITLLWMDSELYDEDELD